MKSSRGSPRNRDHLTLLFGGGGGGAAAALATSPRHTARSTASSPRRLVVPELAVSCDPSIASLIDELAVTVEEPQLLDVEGEPAQQRKLRANSTLSTTSTSSHVSQRPSSSSAKRKSNTDFIKGLESEFGTQTMEEMQQWYRCLPRHYENGVAKAIYVTFATTLLNIVDTDELGDDVSVFIQESWSERFGKAQNIARLPFFLFTGFLLQRAVNRKNLDEVLPQIFEPLRNAVKVAAQGPAVMGSSRRAVNPLALKTPLSSLSLDLSESFDCNRPKAHTSRKPQSARPSAGLSQPPASARTPTFTFGAPRTTPRSPNTISPRDGVDTARSSISGGTPRDKRPWTGIRVIPRASLGHDTLPGPKVPSAKSSLGTAPVVATVSTTSSAALDSARKASLEETGADVDHSHRLQQYRPVTSRGGKTDTKPLLSHRKHRASPRNHKSPRSTRLSHHHHQSAAPAAAELGVSAKSAREDGCPTATEPLPSSEGQTMLVPSTSRASSMLPESVSADVSGLEEHRPETKPLTHRSSLRKPLRRRTSSRVDPDAESSPGVVGQPLDNDETPYPPPSVPPPLTASDFSSSISILAGRGDVTPNMVASFHSDYDDDVLSTADDSHPLPKFLSRLLSSASGSNASEGGVVMAASRSPSSSPPSYRASCSSAVVIPTAMDIQGKSFAWRPTPATIAPSPALSPAEWRPLPGWTRWTPTASVITRVNRKLTLDEFCRRRRRLAEGTMGQPGPRKNVGV